MERWNGKVAIVTGASVGIGNAIAKALAQKGLKVVGLARRVELIEELACTLSDAPGDIFGLKCDLTSEEEIVNAFQWVTDNLGPVHILINNAGLTRPTNLTDGSTSDWHQIFEVNVMALCVCTREAVKIMKQNNIAGHVIHISDAVSGHYVPRPVPVNYFNVYSASKHAVTALAESLRWELVTQQSKIKISNISPGLVRTEFIEGYPDGRKGGVISHNVKKDILNDPALSTADVANAVLYVLGTKPQVQVHELTIKPIGEAF